MYNTNDDILMSSRPQSLTEDIYKEDIEVIIDDGKYHSDEMSETDDEKAQQEIDDHIRPKNKFGSDNNHVIRVYDKPWRSRRVRKVYINYLSLIYSHLLYYRSRKSFARPIL
jgi:hypothetical protein